MNQYKSLNHNQNEKNQVDEQNNNSKNNSSASSSYDDAIDYDDSIQNHDLKDTQYLKIGSSEQENVKFMKTFSNQNNFDDHQLGYNGSVHSNIEDRKTNEDGNCSINYASSDDLNQNIVTSDQGEKLGSGSEDEGKLFIYKKLNRIYLKKILDDACSKKKHRRNRTTFTTYQLVTNNSC